MRVLQEGGILGLDLIEPYLHVCFPNGEVFEIGDLGFELRRNLSLSDRLGGGEFGHQLLLQ